MNTNHKPGTPRSDLARAKISLVMFGAADEVDRATFRRNIGRWEALERFGPVCWAEFNQLCQHLPPARAVALRQILEDSDNGKL